MNQPPPADRTSRAGRGAFRSRSLLLMLGLGAALVAWVLTWMLRDSNTRTVRLTDGREFTLQAVTLGREHRFLYGKPWVKPLGRWVPKRWFPRLGLVDLRYTTEGPSVMFWGVWRTPASVSPFALSVDDASVSDLGGAESEPIRFQRSALAERGRWVMGWNFASFPRRVNQLGLRLYFRDQTQTPNFAGECRVPNPAFREYPVWNGSTTPVACTNEEGEFILSRLTTPQAKPEGSKPVLGYIGPFSTGACLVARGGQVWDGWEIAAVGLLDATGNAFRKTYLPAAASQSAPGFGFNSVFWPSEQGWKLEVEFARTRDFRPEELWAVPQIAIPDSDHLTSHPAQRRFEGMTLAGLELSLYETAAQSSPTALRHGAIKLTLTPPLPGVRVRLVEIRDDQGRTIRFEPAYVNPSGIYGFNLLLPPGSHSLDCTFAVQKTRLVQFLARPDAERGPSPYSKSRSR